MHLFVDSIPKDSQTDAMAGPNSLQVGQIGKTVIEHSLGLKRNTWTWWPLPWAKKQEAPRKKILFLVCGPEPYVCDLDPFNVIL